MTIALARNRKFSGARYAIIGELSRYAEWVQSLELPSDDNTVSISGQTVEITFREREDDSTAILTVSTTESQITITDADTLSISVDYAVMAALTLQEYFVDLRSSVGGVLTHWGHGLVPVRQNPAASS